MEENCCEKAMVMMGGSSKLPSAPESAADQKA